MCWTSNNVEVATIGGVMTGRVHSLESFGTVDGPGIRFVVFFQGCPLRCLYCHNPDTWEAGGKVYTAEELTNQILRYKNYFGDKGGVTATGGEPLLQAEFLIELFTLLKSKGIHTCIDTSGITFNADNEKSVALHKRLLEVTDLVMLDIKHMEDAAHKELTGHSNTNILSFAKYLDEIKKPVWIRHVVVPGITYDKEQLTKFGAFLKTLSNVEKLEVLPYHTLGENKYEKLGMEYPLKGVQQLSKNEAVEAENIILAAWGKNVKTTNTIEEDIKSGGTVCKSC